MLPNQYWFCSHRGQDFPVDFGRSATPGDKLVSPWLVYLSVGVKISESDEK